MEPAPALGTVSNKKPPQPPLPLPPALFLVRARSRACRVADLDDGAAAAAWSSSSGPPDTPPRRSPVTVPFLWEEAPGKPKAGSPAPAAAVPPNAAAAAADATTTPAAGAVDHGAAAAGDAAPPAPAPLKLPPRLQHVASARQQRQRERSVSPKPAALHGPYFYYYSCAGGGGGAKRPPPPRRTASGFAAFRRAPSFGAAGLFSRSTKSKGGGAAAPVDAPWCSPAASSTSSSSSLSASCFGDDNGHGGDRRPVDGREDGSSEEDECARGTAVRITRFRRNRSVPSMTTSHLWASIRKSVKQITPWS